MWVGAIFWQHLSGCPHLHQHKRASVEICTERDSSANFHSQSDWNAEMVKLFFHHPNSEGRESAAYWRPFLSACLCTLYTQMMHRMRFYFALLSSFQCEIIYSIKHNVKAETAFICMWLVECSFSSSSRVEQWLYLLFHHLMYVAAVLPLFSCAGKSVGRFISLRSLGGFPMRSTIMHQTHERERADGCVNVVVCVL